MHSHTVLQNQIYPETAATKSRKHSIFTHFPKDRDCDVCLWNKITRAPCKKLIGKAVLRAEKFGDLITADHKVLTEGSESRHNHRYSIVVQDRTTRWIQSYPCKTKSSHETEKSFSKVLEQSHRSAHRQLDGIWDGMWGFIMESPHFNTSHQSETTGIAERAVRRLKKKKALQQYCYSQDWMKGCGPILECYCYLRNIQDLPGDGKTPYERRFGESFKRP